MARIIGLRRTSFTPKDSDTPIEGKIVYTSEPIDYKSGSGVATDHFFISKAREGTLSFELSVGQEILVLYTKRGKLASVQLLSDPDSIVEIE